MRWFIYSQKSTIKNSSNILSAYAKHKILYPMCRINQREELFKCSRYRLVATDSFIFWRYINVHRLRFFDNVHDLLNFKVHQTKENYVGMCNVFINVIEIRMHIDFFLWSYFLADNNKAKIEINLKIVFINLNFNTNNLFRISYSLQPYTKNVLSNLWT